MIKTHVMALRRSTKTLLLIGTLATGGAAVLTLGLGMDTPWAPWERKSNIMFPPLLFTIATFLATVAFCGITVVFHTLLGLLTNDPDKWWRMCGVLFLIIYGTYSLGSGTAEAALMLNILHLIVGLPALTLIPNAVRHRRNSWRHLKPAL